MMCKELSADGLAQGGPVRGSRTRSLPERFVMKKWVLIAGMLLVVSVAFLSGQPGVVEAEEALTIKQVMVKLHKGASSPLAKLKNELKAETPAWAEIEKQSKDFVIIGASLAKNEPRKGDKEGWKKLADSYFEDAKALDEAAKAHDKAGTDAAFKKLSASCKACHSAHKGQ
jgi:cytochrome c556